MAAETVEAETLEVMAARVAEAAGICKPAEALPGPILIVMAIPAVPNQSAALAQAVAAAQEQRAVPTLRAQADTADTAVTVFSTVRPVPTTPEAVEPERIQMAAR